MPKQIRITLDFGNATRIINLPNAVTDQEPATLAQLKAYIDGLKTKAPVRVATVGNISLTAPGATVDGVTMVLNDRVLVWKQTAGAENGIYIWNGASVAMTRALDANTWDEIESMLVPVEEGTYLGTCLRQTAINGTLGTTALSFTDFGSIAPQATTTLRGTVRLATQAEVNTGTDATLGVTPATLSGSKFATQKKEQVIGDASANTFTITHNFGTRNVLVNVFRNSGNYDEVITGVEHTDTNSVKISFDVAPATNAYTVLVRA